MKILIGGSTGLIGSAVVNRLEERDDDVTHLLRQGAGRASWGGVLWDFNGPLDPARVCAQDAVIHLAGESLAGGRWTGSRKRALRSSRIDSTRRVAEAVALANPRPRVLVCASAIGFYGDRGAEPVDESAGPGRGFLAELCRDWEQAAEPARAAGVRVVHARFGVVLSARGGALRQMLPLFRMGAGGVLGPGTQFMSWVSLDDAAGAVIHLLDHDSVAGPVNVVAPDAVTNEAYTRALARALHRPAFLGVPAFALKLGLGAEMSKEMLLASTRVVPGRLQATGYAFQHATLAAALEAALSRPRR